MSEDRRGVSRASRTAVMVAAYRARATARGDGLCDDPFALHLAGDEGLAYAARYDEAFANMELWLALRTHVIDAQVRARIAEGFRQVVILGAGLDTRAARLSTQAVGVRFFEVDHPASQADKLSRLSRISTYPADAAVYVPCDFERDDFVDCLDGKGFVRSMSSLFVWEGVTYYLPEAAVRGTLSRIVNGAEPQSVVVFDYVGKRFAHGELPDPSDAAARTRVADMGEPIRYGTDDMLPLLHDVGFRRVRLSTFDELCLNLTGTYDRTRKFGFQRLAVASVRFDRLGCDGLP